MRKINPTLVGLFVITSLLLLVGALVALGARTFMAEPPRFVSFFGTSVRGLRPGATVRFRGVPIGTVVDIQLIHDTKDLSFRIPVIMEIYTDKILTESGFTFAEIADGRGKHIEKMITSGLRAELALDSVVTGQLFVQLDYHPATPINLRGPERGIDLPEIPTVPGQLQQITEEFMQLPLREVLNSIERAFSHADRILSSQEIQIAIASFSTMMEEGSAFINKISQGIEPVQSDLKELTDEARVAIASADQAFKAIDQNVGARSPTIYRIEQTLEEISQAARAVSLLAGYLERHPEALLRGKDGGERR